MNPPLLIPIAGSLAGLTSVVIIGAEGRRARHPGSRPQGRAWSRRVALEEALVLQGVAAGLVWI